jgi:chromosome condensin MukBEF MukE localization factor
MTAAPRHPHTRAGLIRSTVRQSRSISFDHVFGHRRLCDFKAELKQFEIRHAA